MIAVTSIVGTVAVYIGARKINKRYPYPLTLPILISSMLIVLVLVTFQIPYETYHIGGQWIEKLLGPAVVALAVPLYKQRKILKAYLISLLAGTIVGSIVGISSGLLFTYWAKFDKEIIHSVIPKSVTTPVAIKIIDSIGGNPTLTSILVIIAGMSGSILYTNLYKLLKITHPIARGVGMGSSSHAIGTAQMVDDSEQETVISTVAMTISAIVVSVLAPIVVAFLS
nr:LrgB family protein [Aquibacillus halophilus]